MRLFALAFAALAAACASVEPPPAQVPTKIEYDVQRGSCRDLERYLHDQGVRDCDGKRLVSAFGVTRCQLESAQINYQVRGDEGWIRDCANVVLKPNPRQFRVKSACIGLIKWQPAQPVPPQCAEANELWNKQVIDHERYHVYQCEQEVWQANKRWNERRHEFSACAFTKRGAFRAVDRKIERALADERERILQAIDAEQQRFHETPAGRPLVTNCRLCDAAQ